MPCTAAAVASSPFHLSRPEWRMNAPAMTRAGTCADRSDGNERFGMRGSPRLEAWDQFTYPRERSDRVLRPAGHGRHDVVSRGVLRELLVREHRRHTAEAELGDVLHRVDGRVE